MCYEETTKKVKRLIARDEEIIGRERELPEEILFDIIYDNYGYICNNDEELEEFLNDVECNCFYIEAQSDEELAQYYLSEFIANSEITEYLAGYINLKNLGRDISCDMYACENYYYCL